MTGVMHLLLISALLLTVASLTAVRVSDAKANLTCAGNFTLRDLSCYSYPGPAVRRSFHHAEKHCSTLRATLASLLSPAEEGFVVELVQNKTAFWIGLTEQGHARGDGQAQFRWTDGADLASHAHWREGEPSATSYLRCVQADREGWALARGGCASTELPFVCKKQACPLGLEWSGSECDIITPSPPPSSLPLLPCLLMILIAFSCSLMLLYCRTSPNTHHHHTHSSNHQHDPC